MKCLSHNNITSIISLRFYRFYPNIPSIHFPGGFIFNLIPKVEPIKSTPVGQFPIGQRNGFKLELKNREPQSEITLSCICELYVFVILYANKENLLMHYTVLRYLVKSSRHVISWGQDPIEPTLTVHCNYSRPHHIAIKRIQI